MTKRYRDEGEAPAIQYRNEDDRDDMLDAKYNLSPAVRVLLDMPGRPRRVGPAVMIRAPELAELFWRDAARMAGSDVESKLRLWSEDNFGRELEPAARAVMRFEINARREGMPSGRSLSLFSSYAEQMRYERAAYEVGPWTGGDDVSALERAEQIVLKATGKRVSEQHPPRPLSKRAWERRANEVKQQARALAAPAIEAEVIS